MNYPSVRRSRQTLDLETSRTILERNALGVLSLVSPYGYPYGLPLNYYYDGEYIWFHCARSGHKLEAIRKDPHASFCVIDHDELVKEEYTTYFRSVIVFGTVEIIEDERVLREAIEVFSRHFYPEDDPENLHAMIARNFPALLMLRMHIEHISGKQARELIGTEI